MRPVLTRAPRVAGVAQDRVGAVVAGLDADLAAEAGDGLEVVGEHVGVGGEHGVDVGELALEVGDQDLDGHVGGGAVAGVQGLGPDAGAAVRRGRRGRRR
jgi:hypothetical protein